MEWNALEEVFAVASQLPTGEVGEYLDEACAGQPELRSEVDSLLDAHRKGASFLEHRPERIGPYRLREEIGRGGMGTVYRGERDDGQFSQQVAIKLLGPIRSIETYRRFLSERQILANLSHRNIARLYDGGVTRTGDHYIVMELVEGVPVHDFCRDKSLAERLRIFLEICGGVHYAHQNLVVHRDLKPANILVTADGTPKLLDFGIAKLLAPGAAAGPTLVPAMTPEYASPEQARGEAVTTASDVYSLGVLLHELATGRRPHQLAGRTHAEIIEILSRHPVLKPATGSDDLDSIIAKALQPEPVERYGSAEALAADIQRMLARRPVEARRRVPWYVFKRFVARNRLAVVASCWLVLLLAGGLLAAMWQARVADRQRKLAERRYQDIRKLANSFLVEHDAIGSLPGGTAVRGKLLQSALEYLNSAGREAGDDPAFDRELAQAYERIGDVQGRADGPNLGDTHAAVASYRKAIAIRERHSAAASASVADGLDLARAYGRLSGALKVAGDYKGGVVYAQRAIDIHAQLAAGNPANLSYQRRLASSYTAYGGSLSQIGDWNGVVAARERALSIWREINRRANPSEDDRRGLILANTRMSSILQHQRDYARAIEYSRSALSTAEDGVRAFPQSAGMREGLATAHNSFGRFWLNQDRYDVAWQHYRKAHQISATLAAADPHDQRTASLLATSHFWLGRVLIGRRLLAQARAELETSLRMREQIAHRNLSNAGARGEVAESLAALADLDVIEKNPRSARARYEAARQILGELQKTDQANAASQSELTRVAKELELLARR